MSLMDDGTMEIYTLTDTAETGNMPRMKLQLFKKYPFGYRLIGYNRQYAAMGVNEAIDELVRIWQDRKIRIGMYAIINGEQFRITAVQHLDNTAGLAVSELTLVRLGENYDIDNTVNSNT